MRRPASSRSEVIVAAMSFGKSAAAQSALMPRPMTARGSAVPRPLVSPRTPPILRTPPGPLSSRIAMTRSFGHLSRTVPGGQPGGRLGRLGHRQRRDGRQPPDLGGRQPGRPEPERHQQRRIGRRDPDPTVAPPTRRLLVGDQEADLRRPGGQPVAHDVIRGTDAREVLTPGEERRHRGRIAHPAAAAPASMASTVSGRSSSKASCSARSAVSRSASAIMQVIRTSDVEIISMLTPASASVPNMRAA